MALRTRLTRTAPPPPRAVVAAATSISRAQLHQLTRNTTGTGNGWQEEAWTHYDLCGEFRFAASWIANVLSRVRLFASYDDDAEDEPVAIEEGRPAEILSALHGGAGGQSQMLRRLGVHLSVPGESFVVTWRDSRAGPQHWATLCGDEVTSRATGEVLIKVDGEDIELPDEHQIVRIWRPHPRYSWDADSPARGLLPVLRELERLSARVVAQIESRLAGAGLLFLPDTMTFPVEDDDGTVRKSTDLTAFMTTLARAMITPITDRDSAAAVVPILAQASPEAIEAIRHISLATELDAQTQELREGALRRLALGVDMPPEILLGLGDSNHWCVDHLTEILTADGWVTHDQLKEGDNVLTLNHDTGLSEWQPVQAVNRFHVTDEPMVSIEGRCHSSLTTSDHKWPVLRGKPSRRERVFTTSRQLGNTDFLITGAPHADLPTEPKYSDAFVEVMAWYFTEGTCQWRHGRNRAMVNIHQSAVKNPENVQRITRALTALYGPATDGPLDTGGRRATPETLARREREVRLRAAGWTIPQIAAEAGISTAQVAKDLRIAAGDITPRQTVTEPRWRITTKGQAIAVFKLNGPAGEPFTSMAPGRIVPAWFIRQLTAAQLDLFIETAIRGDGYVMGRNTKVFAQKDPRMVEAFELAAILSGRSVTARSNHTKGFTWHTQNLVSVRENTMFGPRDASPSRPAQHFSWEYYTGTVWCPTTGNRTWLARRNGSVYFTGNSAWEISESAVTQHVEPLMEIISEGLASQYFRPALDQLGVPDVDRYRISFDTAELVNRPNRGPDAILLYDRGEINGAALRREHGFSDTDAYTAAESRQRDLREMVSHSALDSDTANRLLELLGYVQPGQIPAGTGGGPAAATALPAQPSEPPPQLRDMPPPPALASSAEPAGPPALIAVQAVAQYAAAAALEYAGKRLIACDRSFRGRYKDVPHHELHTHIPVTRSGQYQPAAILDGAFRTFDQLPELAPVRDVVAAHVEWLLLQGLPLDRKHLDAEIRAAFTRGQP